MTDGTVVGLPSHAPDDAVERPRVRPDLLVSAELGRGPHRVHLLRVPGGATFEVSPKECFLIRNLDGRRSLAEVGAAYAARFGRRLGPAQWSQLLWLLRQRDLLATGDRAGAAVAPRLLLARLATAFGWAFSLPAGVAVGIGFAALYAVVAVESPRLWQDARPVFGDWRWVVGIVAVSYLSAMLHELAHGVAATHFGCSGVRINVVALSCRVEDYQFLPSRAGRVVIAAVGGVLNSIVTVPFLLVWLFSTPGSASHRFAAAVVLVGTVQSLVNYVPLAPLDGYKMLSHLLGVVALGPESRRYLWSRPRQWVSRRGPRYPGRARLALGLYGTGWHVATAALGVGVAWSGGRLLEPSLGRAGHAVSAAVVVLTVCLWLAGLPRHRTRTDPSNQATR
ncbi:peptidase M50 [Micromonospora sp. NPDC051925]|uniref:peptidase M50 n=1 Tax=Micromonospora sp. NPDC051925 TaxID=3364288 RepID=UPI0037C5B21E